MKTYAANIQNDIKNFVPLQITRSHLSLSSNPGRKKIKVEKH